jgi:hypothetical protein
MTEEQAEAEQAQAEQVELGLRQSMTEWLAGFYGRWKIDSIIQHVNQHGIWYQNDSGPCMSSIPHHWRYKPFLKVIDLSALVGSGFDCEFWQEGMSVKDYGLIYKTKMNSPSGECTFGLQSRGRYHNCQPRMSTEDAPFVHFWKGGIQCPVPEGFYIRVHFRVGIESDVQNSDDLSNFRWNHDDSHGDIIGVEFLGVMNSHTLSGDDQ